MSKVTVNRGASVIVLFSILLMNLSEFTNLTHVRLPLFIALFVISLPTKLIVVINCTLIILLMHCYWLVVPASLENIPVLGFLLPFAVATVFNLAFGRRKEFLIWLKRGALDRLTLFLIFLTGLCSAIALIIWAKWTDNLGIGAQMVKGFGSTPQWIIFLVFIPIFAVLNAFAEEVVFRGVIQEGTNKSFGAGAVSLTLQAAAFAVVHYSSGFPNGLVGYGMVFVYALMLGYLRNRSGGLFAPWAAHVVADVTIASFLVLHSG